MNSAQERELEDFCKSIIMPQEDEFLWVRYRGTDVEFGSKSPNDIKEVEEIARNLMAEIHRVYRLSFELILLGTKGFRLDRKMEENEIF